MADNSFPPIALFAYDRPGHLQSALASLARSDGFDRHPLYIFCDAPAGPVAEQGSAAVRAIASDWTAARGGETVFRETNLRFHNITDGISQLCGSHGRVIVVEDDLIVSPDFLPFMRAGLERYQDETNVYLVSGYMFPSSLPPTPQTCFLPFAFVWGWATWARAWVRYSWRPAGWESLLLDPARRSRFDLDGGFKFAEMLRKTMSGEIDTWDIQWNYTVFNDDAVGLYPWRPLVMNVGFGSGVHMADARRSRRFHGDEAEEDFLRPRLSEPFSFPTVIQADEAAMLRLSVSQRRPPRNRGSRWLRRLRRLLGRA